MVSPVEIPSALRKMSCSPNKISIQKWHQVALNVIKSVLTPILIVWYGETKVHLDCL